MLQKNPRSPCRPAREKHSNFLSDDLSGPPSPLVRIKRGQNVMNGNNAGFRRRKGLEKFGRVKTNKIFNGDVTANLCRPKNARISGKTRGKSALLRNCPSNFLRVATIITAKSDVVKMYIRRKLSSSAPQTGDNEGN